ncbi:MAG TPA: glutamate--tRNA ligase, partial [Campylobacterales bacterium]|nr:glutamate--tRNA ligase [Campylobacterales bacterium]
ALFHQSEHLNLHQTLALRLLKEGKAFICKCTEKELENSNYYSGHCETLKEIDYEKLKASGEDFVIRVKKPSSTISYRDLFHGEQTATPNEIDSFVILRKDGTPTENFASATDDMISNISFILRDEKHLSNTPKQIYIKKLLGYETETHYAHLPKIVHNQGEEFSSDASSLSVKWLFEQGFIPDAILNYLLQLGNSETPTEIFTLPDAIKWFDLHKLSKSTSTFDLEDLRSINREHLKKIDDKALSKQFGFADADIGKLAKLYLDESATINELEAKIRPIFSPKDFSTELGDEMKLLSNLIFDAPAFQTLEELTGYLKTKSNLDTIKIEHALKLLLTGSRNGPEISKVYPLIKSYLLEVAS